MNDASTVTRTNCQLVVGMSWRWVMGFVRTHDVPVWRVGTKKLVPARALLAAIEAASGERSTERTGAERRADFAREFTRQKR